jgi:hypothetical protein
MLKKIAETIKKVRGHFTKQNIELENRIKILEETVFALKTNVKEKKKEVEIVQKKKWLNGYPDESTKG